MRKLRIVLSTLVCAAMLAACSNYTREDGGGDSSVPATTTTPTPDGATTTTTPENTGTDTSPWPLLDNQKLPTGVTEGGEFAGALRNLGAVDVPWTESPAGQVAGRAHAEPLFAISLAQEFGWEAAGQVAFWGLDGLQEDGRWTEAGNDFLKLLELEIQERFLGVSDSLPDGKVKVVVANAERDAVQLTFASDKLVDVSVTAVFRTECGQVAVDVRGNLYVPCDCGRYRVVKPPTTTGGKDHTKAPPTTTVVTCPSGQHMSRETGLCVPDSTTGGGDSGDPSDGDSGVGAPGTGVTTPSLGGGGGPAPPTTDPVTSITVPDA